MLDIRDLSIHYGMIPAVKNLNMFIKKGEVVSLIGTNGAGKSTTLRGISGLVKAKDGSIHLEGKNILKINPHKIVERGISHVPEGRGIFTELSVLENLRMGAFIRNDTDEVYRDLQKMFRYFPRLEERKTQVAGTLSGGEQQMLSIGRALMARPKLLLLDEPSMGLAPILVKEIFQIIKKVNEEGLTILLVEQNAKMALSVSHRGYVLETGEIVAQGTVNELRNNDMIQKIYLGIN